jgi:hypothetical protein
MKALISKIEPRMDGYRVAQVINDNEVFDVTSDFMWINCDNTIVADAVWYNPTTQSMEEFPALPTQPQVTIEDLQAQLQEIQNQINSITQT